MFCDLNVCVENRESAIETLLDYGYDIIAFNTIVNTKRLTDEHLPVRTTHPAFESKVSSSFLTPLSILRIFNLVTNESKANIQLSI